MFVHLYSTQALSLNHSLHCHILQYYHGHSTICILAIYCNIIMVIQPFAALSCIAILSWPLNNLLHCHELYVVLPCSLTHLLHCHVLQYYHGYSIICIIAKYCTVIMVILNHLHHCHMLQCYHSYATICISAIYCNVIMVTQPFAALLCIAKLSWSLNHLLHCHVLQCHHIYSTIGIIIIHVYCNFIKVTQPFAALIINYCNIIMVTQPFVALTCIVILSWSLNHLHHYHVFQD